MILISIAQAVAALYVLLASVLSLNLMSRRTHPAIFWSHIMLVAAAIGGAMSSVKAPNAFECIALVGIALYLKGNRRASKP